MFRRYAWRLSLFSVALWLTARTGAAITLQVDYTYDSSNFFGSGNPQGAAAGVQAKASLEAAAMYFSNLLSDTFSTIQTPSSYDSSVSDGVVTWSWQEVFAHPTTGSQVVVTDATIPSDQYVIYAGARDLTGTTAGVGAVGGYGWSSQVSGTNEFSDDDLNQINVTTASFESAVEMRGETTGFARWGGAISFDTSARTWHFDHTSLPSGNVTDFYSVAIHELSHSLGFGAHSGGPDVSTWDTLVNQSVNPATFVGSSAVNQNGGAAVPLSADKSHWAMGTSSVVYGSTTAQETAMDPDLLNGTRKRFTALDATALRDLGWDVTHYGDYNDNGVVDVADYIVWRQLNPNASAVIPNDGSPGSGVNGSDYTFWQGRYGNVTPASGGSVPAAGAAVPEPDCAALALLSIMAAGFARRRQANRRHCNDRR